MFAVSCWTIETSFHALTDRTPVTRQTLGRPAQRLQTSERFVCGPGSNSGALAEAARRTTADHDNFCCQFKEVQMSLSFAFGNTRSPALCGPIPVHGRCHCHPVAFSQNLSILVANEVENKRLILRYSDR